MKMTLKNQVILSAVAGVLIVILAAWFLVKPQIETLGETREELEKADNEIMAASTKLGLLTAFQSESPKTELAILKGKKTMPDAMEYPTLLADIPAFLDETKVEWSWDKLKIIPPSAESGPQQPTQPGQQASATLKQSMTTSIEMQVEDSYVGITNFIERIRKQPRYFKILSFAINPPADSEGSDTEPDAAYDGRLDCFFILNAYQYKQTTMAASTEVKVEGSD